MSLKPEQYIALSAAAYGDYSDDDKNQKIDRIRNKMQNNKLECSELGSLSDYTLIDFTSTSSGFRAAAFQSPSGEIVFSFKGTDFDPSNPKTYMDTAKDIANADAQIAFGNSVGLPAQFTEAEKFVDKVCSSHLNSECTFTGHSLGGALAQYMTYKTGHKSTTFNAPGVANLIESVTGQKIDYKYYKDKSINYANESDFIGNLWSDARIGSNKIVRSKLNSTTTSDLVAMYKMQAMVALGGPFMPFIGGGVTLKIFIDGLNAMGKIAKNMVPTANHGMSDMLTDDGKMMPTTNQPDYGISYMGYLTRGTKIALEGGAFVFYVYGGLVYHGADGVCKFFNTAGNLLADGIWNSYSFLRSVFSGDLKGIFDLFSSATVAARVDPLILDLNGDGLATTNLDQSDVYFDLDSNGFAERTAWIDANDGLLVLDRDGDGKITNGQELFGDQTLLSNGTRATSGFEALREFDDNKDGKIDASDIVYLKLKVWQDLNRDGVSQAEEMKSLADVGIKAINLSSTFTGAADAMGNIQRRLGSFVKTDGSDGQIGEYLLNRDTMSSRDTFGDSVTIPDDIAALPDLQGAGNVSSLRIAMAKDESGQLKKIVLEFLETKDAAARDELFTNVIYKWAGADKLDPNGRGGLVDARQLAVLEKFMGMNFAGTNGANPNANAAPLLQKAYYKLVDRLYAAMASATYLKDIISRVNYKIGESGAVIEFTDVINDIDKAIDNDSVSGKQLLADFLRVVYGSGLSNDTNLLHFCNHFAAKSPELARIVYSANRDAIIGSDKSDSLSGGVADDLLYGDAGDDHLNGDAGNDTLYGGEGNDNMYGYLGDDFLYGGTGRDDLYGGEGDDVLDGGSDVDYLEGGDGNDTLIGGQGSDSLYGGIGDDTYIFNKGDGEDYIMDIDGEADVVQFGEGIKSSDLQFTRAGGCGANLVITVGATGDRIVINNYFNAGGDYSKQTDVYKIEKFLFADGTAIDRTYIYEQVRTIAGTDDAESLFGYNDQNNYIHGFGGNDSLSGGVADDLLYGDAGDDHLNGDAGNDTLYGGEGNDNMYGYLGDDFLYGGTGRDDLYGGEGDDVLDGGSDVDYLEGGDGNDTLIGGQGSDSLYGGIGDDTYIFNKGDGEDYIMDIDGEADKVRLEYEPISVVFERVNNDLRLRMPGSLDAITVSSWYSSDNYKIETFKSANGSAIAHTQVESLIQAMSSFQKDSGMTWEQALTNQPAQVQSIIQQYWTAPTT